MLAVKDHLRISLRARVFLPLFRNWRRGCRARVRSAVSFPKILYQLFLRNDFGNCFLAGLRFHNFSALHLRLLLVRDLRSSRPGWETRIGCTLRACLPAFWRCADKIKIAGAGQFRSPVDTELLEGQPNSDRKYTFRCSQRKSPVACGTKFLFAFVLRFWSAIFFSRLARQSGPSRLRVQ